LAHIEIDIADDPERVLRQLNVVLLLCEGEEGAMVGKRVRSPLCFGVLLGTVLLGLQQSPAKAQFGMGYGGFMGGFNYVPSPTDFINSHALIQAGRGQQAPASFRPYANNPNSFHNRLRDNGFVPSYDVRRRQPTTARAQPARSQASSTTIASARTPAPKQIAPLASFFDSAMKLIWPSESPVDGDLGDKRDTSDQASLAVLKETKEHQLASLATVTDARQKLLDYGRPALKQIRLVATTRIADIFHDFMLSLYDSLEHAAVPSAALGAAPKP
jgi:hypothetical protein